VVRTHYPRTREDSLAITRDNAWLERGAGKDAGRDAPGIELPRFMSEIIEEFVRLARTSPHVNQQSGVSVRASITCAETLASNAERRGILTGETRVAPRICDLANVNASCRGKLELMLAEDEQAEDKLITALLGEAVKNVAADYLDLEEIEPVIEQFHGGKVNLEVGDDISAEQLVDSARSIKGLLPAAEAVCKKAELSQKDPAALASAAEFILEALYVNNRLTKYTYRGGTYYKK
jgi:magnesium chelatase subunit I